MRVCDRRASSPNVEKRAPVIDRAATCAVRDVGTRPRLVLAMATPPVTKRHLNWSPFVLSADYSGPGSRDGLLGTLGATTAIRRALFISCRAASLIEDERVDPPMDRRRHVRDRDLTGHVADM
jgi:hypothetical protein